MASIHDTEGTSGSKATNTPVTNGVSKAVYRKHAMSIDKSDQNLPPAKKTKIQHINEIDANTVAFKPKGKRSRSAKGAGAIWKTVELCEPDFRASSISLLPADRIYGHPQAEVEALLQKFSDIDPANAFSNGSETAAGTGGTLPNNWSARKSSKKESLVEAKITHNLLDTGRAPLSDINDIFSDLASKAIKLGFLAACANFQDQPLRIVTMCSGTESPILAMRLLQRGIALLPFLRSDMKLTSISLGTGRE
jgi:hypothetical protein